MISITTPATDRNLLTAVQLRRAAGVSADSVELTELGLRVSDSISNMCKVISDGVSVPTLRSETITQTFRSVCQDELLLDRVPVTSITSVTVDDTVLADTEYEQSTGLLRRLNTSDHQIRWYGRKIVIVYVAGYATVPTDLALAAAEYVKLLWSAGDRDPTKKAEWIDGMGKDEWFEGGDDMVMESIKGRLAPYMNYGV